MRPGIVPLAPLRSAVLRVAAANRCRQYNCCVGHATQDSLLVRDQLLRHRLMLGRIRCALGRLRFFRAPRITLLIILLSACFQQILGRALISGTCVIAWRFATRQGSSTMASSLTLTPCPATAPRNLGGRQRAPGELGWVLSYCFCVFVDV